MNNLPDEIIVMILNYLSYKDLAKCMELSHKFRDLIIKSSSLMRKMRFKYRMEVWTEYYQFLKKHGEYLKNLELYGVNFECQDNFFKLLTLVPNLEKLSNSYYKMHDHSDPKPKKPKIMEDVNFEHLTHVVIEDYIKMHEIFIKLLKNSQKLKSIKLTFDVDDDEFRVNNDKFNFDYCNVLVQQEDLVELVIKNMYRSYEITSFLKSIGTQTFPFKLKKLKVLGCFNWNEDFAGFLRSQAEYVKDIEFSFSDDSRYLELVLQDFNSLETVRICCNDELEDQINEKFQNDKLENVRKLYVKNFHKTSQLKAIMSLFPNIELLSAFETKYFADIDYEKLLVNFGQLSHIEIEKVYCEGLNNVALPNLKILKINKFIYDYESQSWPKFIKNCPNIEVIIINKPVIIDLEHAPRKVPVIISSLKDSRNLKIFKYEALNLHDDKYEVEIDVERKLIQINSVQNRFLRNIEVFFNDFFNITYK